MGGYLVCDKCKGYYELQPGELLTDFDLKCNCGGELNFHNDFNDDCEDNNDSNEFILCDLCKTENLDYSVYCMECGVKLSETNLKNKIKNLLTNLCSNDPTICSKASTKLFMDLNPNSTYLNNPNDVKRIILYLGIDPIINVLKQDNHNNRINMAWCLGYLDNEIVVPPLIEFLDDDELSGACIANLVKLKDYSIKPLIDILSSEDLTKANAAANALGEIGDTEAVVPLLKLFLSNPDVSYGASGALSKIKSDKAVEPLIESLGNDNKKLKRQSAFILGNIGDENAIEPLIKSLDDNDAYFRRQSIVALGKINNERVIEPLINALNDKTALVKGAAAESLGNIGDKSSLEYLKPLLNDKNENVKKIANIAIEKLQYIPKKHFVPEWDGYYPNLDSATIEQKEFYNKWLTEFNQGNYIDIEGNLSYIFSYMYNVINQFVENKDIITFLDNFRKIEIGYNNYEKLKSYISYWRICAYLYLDQRNRIWDEVKSAPMNLDTTLTAAYFLPEFDDSYFDGPKMIQIMGDEGLTQFGRENSKNIGNIATIIFDDFKNENNKHIINFFIEEFNLENLSESDFNSLKNFFPKQEKFLECKNIYESKEKGKNENLYYGKTLKNYEFQGFPGVPISYPDNDPKFMKVLHQKYDDEKVYVPLIVIEALKNEVKRIFRESENIYREEKDIPKVGEGWVSETALYHQIKNTFPEEDIIHHGRPSWLGRQHLDIYFPKRNIGIEYQGDQHDSPIDYFGGKEGFENRKALDARKKEKCKMNYCYLMYVYPNYNFKEIKEEIINQIIKNTSKPHLDTKDQGAQISSSINEMNSGIYFVNYNVEKIESKKRGKSEYLIGGKALFAEEVGIKFYETMGYNASWTENDYWWFVMALIFWDEIFAPIKGVFNIMPLYSSMNDMPNDFFKPEFYQKRKNLIHNRIKMLQNADPATEISKSYKKNYGKCCRPIEDWNRYTLDELLIPIKVMDKNAFLGILTRLISNFNAKRSGLPDLIVFNNKELFFSEVKSEKDTISDNQKEWHRFLVEKMKLKVDLFLINQSEKKINNIKSSYTFLNREFRPNGDLNDFKKDIDLLKDFVNKLNNMINNRKIQVPDGKNFNREINLKIREIQKEVKLEKRELNKDLKVLNADMVIFTPIRDFNNPSNIQFNIRADKDRLNQFIEYYKNNEVQ